MTDKDAKRRYSSQVVDGLEKAAARAMLHAVAKSRRARQRRAAA